MPRTAAGRRERLAELRAQRELAVHGAQVEEDADAQHGFRVGQRRPVAKMREPIRDRLSPLVRGRHHLTRAVRIAAGVEPVADDACQCREIRRRCRRCVVGVHEPVVLVGLAGSVRRAPASRRRATHTGAGEGPSRCSARPSSRRVTASLSVVSTFGTCSARMPEATSNSNRRGICGRSRPEPRPKLAFWTCAARYSGCRVCSVMRSRVVTMPNDASVARERQVMDPAADHREDAFEHRARGIERQRVVRHDRRYGFGRVASLREHAVAQVAVGHDAAHLLALGDEQRGNSVLRHRACRRCDRGFRGRDDQLAARELAHRRHEQRLAGRVARLRSPRSSRSSMLRMKNVSNPGERERSSSSAVRGRLQTRQSSIA